MSNNTSAIASWLGYTAQEYRLVQRLLKADKGNVLGFEILDDLQEHSQGGLVLEQDKLSTTSRNIVSNQSQDLWKTLSNWVDLIRNGDIDASITQFLLYTNSEHSSDVLKLLCEVSDINKAKIAYSQILDIVKNSSTSIKGYVENFVNFDDRKFLLMSNFQYLHGNGSLQQDLKSTYLSINTSITEHSESILQEILGWTKDVLTNLAERRAPTLLKASAFGKRLGEIESKYRQQTLLEFVCNRASSDEDVQSQIVVQPNYIKQLNIINIDDEDILEAVLAKLESKDAVSKWTEEGHIQESSYSTYNNTLKTKWKEQKKLTYMEHKCRTNEELGFMLYYQCRLISSNVKLENKEVNSFFSHGSLQELSDIQQIGWHPNYKIILKGGNDDT